MNYEDPTGCVTVAVHSRCSSHNRLQAHRPTGVGPCQHCHVPSVLQTTLPPFVPTPAPPALTAQGASPAAAGGRDPPAAAGAVAGVGHAAGQAVLKRPHAVWQSEGSVQAACGRGVSRVWAGCQQPTAQHVT